MADKKQINTNVSLISMWVTGLYIKGNTRSSILDALKQIHTEALDAIREVDELKAERAGLWEQLVRAGSALQLARQDERDAVDAERDAVDRVVELEEKLQRALEEREGWRHNCEHAWRENERLKHAPVFVNGWENFQGYGHLELVDGRGNVLWRTGERRGHNKALVRDNVVLLAEEVPSGFYATGEYRVPVRDEWFLSEWARPRVAMPMMCDGGGKPRWILKKERRRGTPS